MTKPVNTREIILGILWEITEEERYSHVVIRETLEKYQYLKRETERLYPESQKELWKI